MSSNFDIKSVYQRVAPAVTALLPVMKMIAARVQENANPNGCYKVAKTEQNYKNRTPIVFATYVIRSAAAAGSGGDVRLSNETLVRELLRRVPVDDAKKLGDLQVTQSPPDANGNVIVAFFSVSGFPVLDMAFGPAMIDSRKVMFVFPANWRDTMLKLKLTGFDGYKLPDDPTELKDMHMQQLAILATDILTDQLPPRVKEMMGRQALLRESYSMEVWSGVCQFAGNEIVQAALHEYGPVMMEKLGITTDDLKAYFGEDSKTIARSGMALCKAGVSIGMMASNLVSVIQTLRESKSEFKKYVQRPMEVIAERVQNIDARHSEILEALEVADPSECRIRLGLLLTEQLEDLKEILNQIDNCKAQVVTWMETAQMKKSLMEDQALASAMNAFIGGVGLAVNLYAGGMSKIEVIGSGVSIGADVISAATSLSGALYLGSLVGRAKGYVIVYDNLSSELSQYTINVEGSQKSVTAAGSGGRSDQAWKFFHKILKQKLTADSERLKRCMEEVKPFLKSKK